jgi:hypothetical protein
MKSERQGHTRGEHVLAGESVGSARPQANLATVPPRLSVYLTRQGPVNGYP